MYKIKLAKDLEMGDIFYVHGIKHLVKKYNQCLGAGSFEFGEYGILYFWKPNIFSDDNNLYDTWTFQNAPYLVLDREERA